MDPQQPISIVLLGATGNGKSTLANIICGDEKFEAKDDVSSVTQRCQHADFTYRGKCYRVVDTVGFKDTSLSDEQVMEQLQQTSIHAMEGVTAFIIVLRHGRFTSSEHLSLMAIKNTFTEDALKKHACIVVTHTENNTSKEIGDKIKQSDNVKYKSWYDKVEGRVLAAEKDDEASIEALCRHFNEHEVEDQPPGVRENVLAMVEEIARDNNFRKWSHEKMVERFQQIRALSENRLDSHHKAHFAKYVEEVHAGWLDPHKAHKILEDFLRLQDDRRRQEGQLREAIVQAGEDGRRSGATEVQVKNWRLFRWLCAGLSLCIFGLLCLLWPTLVLVSTAEAAAEGAAAVAGVLGLFIAGSGVAASFHGANRLDCRPDSSASCCSALSSQVTSSFSAFHPRNLFPWMGGRQN
ncbi:unnamed protein product [Vitrella brassicaformis CCMP3155]|uniref:AIG1-type G domain-containing protein n=2 Tax=Vitrella brassicaformis TaxID=1169539 RepID=A0A0G4GHJ9_VITBC|nr:unnamed protein product [Vitrella brassicaformis CCMP3155]|eukprot:CEM29216.1 unnamed protein product [Vitrella brassicaformis CCMP3155]